MRSLWELDAPAIETDPFPADDRPADVVVVGAGITGLVSAMLFAEAGQDVIVLEARRVGAGTTGRTTAKVSQLQGTMLQQVRRGVNAASMAAYVESQRAAFDWLLHFAEQHDVPLEHRAAATVALSPVEVDAVETEHRLARAHGLTTRLMRSSSTVFPAFAEVRLADQAQIEPLRLLAALAARFRAAGGRIVEDARVTGVRASRRSGEPAVLRTVRGELRAEKVVLATGMPFLDRGLYFAKLAPRRSYAQAWRVPAEQLPDAMYLGVGEGTRSVRDARGLLLVGGNGHPVGRHPSPRRASDELAEWTQRYWPGAEPEVRWSAQDYVSPHGVPFVGWLPRGAGKVYLATGFSKWGMTNGVATALTLVADILGGSTDWMRTLHRRMTMPGAVATGIGENAAIGLWYAKSWARALRQTLPATAPEGYGTLGRRGVLPHGVSTVGGVTREVCAVCPHLGAVVQWNDFEQSWDCPAHGSRFSPDGTVLEGPATRGLAGPAATR